MGLNAGGASRVSRSGAHSPPLASIAYSAASSRIGAELIAWRALITVSPPSWLAVIRQPPWPSLAVPVGRHGRLRPGVQIMAPRFREDLCLAAGEVIEAAEGIVTPIDPAGA